MEVFGIRLVGVNAHNGVRLLITILFIFTIVAIGRALNGLILRFLSGRRYFKIRFWILQSITLLLTVTTILGLLSIWFEDPARLATALGLITAGLVFALQRVITAFAGYLVILRGETFNIGDRITMGGVRGDVIGLGFIQTTIMEMGKPPEISDNNTSVWVRSRQYTGRIVTITNDKVFTEPVFNYSREFPYIWDELRVPTPYSVDHAIAEQIVLDATRQQTTQLSELSQADLEELCRRYLIRKDDVFPRVYWRLTDNWLELSVRFIAHVANIREVKDAISRGILFGFDEAKIPIASETYDVVHLPPLRIENQEHSLTR